MNNKIKYWINKMSRILKIIPPRVVFIYDSPSFYSSMVLHIHVYHEYEKTLFLALHELRHYYQEIYMNTHNNEKALLIKYEMNHYHAKDYKSLFIERDAYSFAYYVMLHFIHIDYKPSLDVKEMVFNFEKNFMLILDEF